MNSNPSRQTYGILPLTPATIAAIQLEFAMVERAAPRARFLNFPLADDEHRDARAHPPLLGHEGDRAA